MRAKTVAILLTTVFLLMSPSILAGSEEDEDHDEDPREFQYVGSETIDLSCCLLYRPPDLPPPACDETDGIAGSGIHGIGEGRFCGIQKGRPARVYLEDQFMDGPEGRVYCPTGVGPYNIFGIEVPYPIRTYQKIGETGSAAPFIVSPGCMDTESGGKTDLLVRLQPGTAVIGTAQLDLIGSD